MNLEGVMVVRTGPYPLYLISLSSLTLIMSGVNYPDHYPEDLTDYWPPGQIDFPQLPPVITPPNVCPSTTISRVIPCLIGNSRLVSKIYRDASDAHMMSGEDTPPTPRLRISEKGNLPEETAVDLECDLVLQTTSLPSSALDMSTDL